MSSSDPSTMRALRLGTDGLHLDSDHPRPRPGPGMALLHLQVAGICSTDLELVKGYFGFQGILGHEFVATVAECDEACWIGKRVVGSINLGCGQCRQCLGEGSEHCPNRTVLGIAGHDGAFADYLTLPIANLLEVPDSVSNEAAVFTEPLAAALRIREQTLVRPGCRAAVVGPGRLGLLIAQVLALGGGDVTVLGRRQASLELPISWGLSVGLVDEGASDSFDLVVEATGDPKGLSHSLRLVRPRGTLVLKSTFHGPATVDLTKLVVAEIEVLGSRCGPFAPALRLLERSQVDVTSLIQAKYCLDRGLEAFEHAARPGVLKVLLRP